MISRLQFLCYLRFVSMQIQNSLRGALYSVQSDLVEYVEIRWRNLQTQFTQIFLTKCLIACSQGRF